MDKEPAKFYVGVRENRKQNDSQPTERNVVSLLCNKCSVGPATTTGDEALLSRLPAGTINHALKKANDDTQLSQL